MIKAIINYLLNYSFIGLMIIAILLLIFISICLIAILTEFVKYTF